MNVLSLFDGMSCGHQALDRANIKVDKYFASEIDKYAIQVTMANYPETIQLGDVRELDGTKLPSIDLLMGGSPCQSFSFAGKRRGMATKCEVEILSLEHYLELKAEQYEFEGQSYLFWEFIRMMNDVKPKYFLLENVVMTEKWEKILSKAIGCNPIKINSSRVSAQNRVRLYWTNIGMQAGGLFGDLESIIQQPKDKGIFLRDVLEDNVDEKYFLSDKMIQWLDRHSQKNGNEFKKKNGDDKSSCITSTALVKGNLSSDYIVHSTFGRTSKSGNGGSGPLSREDGKTYCLDTANSMAVEAREVKQLNLSTESGGKQPYQQDRIYDINGIAPALQAQLSGGSSLINTSRIRRLTPIECERLQNVADGYTNYVSDSQRYKMLGNGWTIDVIAHIFSYI